MCEKRKEKAGADDGSRPDGDDTASDTGQCIRRSGCERASGKRSFGRGFRNHT